MNYDEGYDDGYRAGMQKMREIGQARIDELEAKREWVGLTEVEIRYALREWAETNQTCREMMYAIEDKLKEKNA